MVPAQRCLFTMLLSSAPSPAGPAAVAPPPRAYPGLTKCQALGPPGIAGSFSVPWGVLEADRSPWGPGWCPPPLRPCLLSADFNENGFIDEEDLQRIVLRLLNSDDVSEDLLTDLMNHVCACGRTG